MSDRLALVLVADCFRSAFASGDWWCGVVSGAFGPFLEAPNVARRGALEFLGCPALLFEFA